MRTPIPRVLYQNSDFRITLRNTGSDMLIVAFSPMQWKDQHKSDRYWGDAVATKVPFSWLSIDAIKDHWFCDDKWQQVGGLVTEIAQRFAVRIGYGHSMGAYGALKRSRDYMPQTILSFAPQCSIHPDDIGKFDARYVKAFDPELHKGMRLQSSDIVCKRAFVFFDAGFEPDREHVARIKGTNVEHVCVAYMRHNVIFAAKGAIPLSYLLLRSLVNEPCATPELYRYLRTQKKNTPDYHANLAYKALKLGHSRWAMDIASQALQLDAHFTRAALLRLQACMQLDLKEAALQTIDRLNPTKLSDGDVVTVAHAMRRLGLGERALSIIERPSISEGSDTKCIRALADHLLAEGNLNRAVKLFERAVGLAPEDPHCLVHLAKALIRNRNSAEYDLQRAIALLKKATEIAPAKPEFWKAYAFVLESSGDMAGAFLAWSRVESMTALGLDDRNRFDRLRLKVSIDDIEKQNVKR